jgi:hypothetical protein
LVGRDQDDINMLICQHLPRLFALLLALLGDTTIDKFSGVGNLIVELFNLDAFVPG